MLTRLFQETSCMLFIFVVTLVGEVVLGAPLIAKKNSCWAYYLGVHKLVSFCYLFNFNCFGMPFYVTCLKLDYPFFGCISSSPDRNYYS